jgi:hypothetical protein
MEIPQGELKRNKKLEPHYKITLRRRRQRYDYARSLGLNSVEAMLVRDKSKERIAELARGL